MRRAYRPGVAILCVIGFAGVGWPGAVSQHGIFGAGGAAGVVSAAICGLLLIGHPLVRSRPALFGIATLLVMSPFVAFLIGCVIQPSLPDGANPALSRSTATLIALCASLAALVGFLLAIVRVLQIRGGHGGHVPAE